jgi:hypothetical protein
MVTGKQNKDNKPKEKAQKLDITQLVVLSAYGKTYSTGKRGFFGKVMDSHTGKRYQIVTAVEIAG